MSTLGVIVPTRNCHPQLPRHIESLTAWLDLAEEVVVVDSFSTDGTIELIQANLRHPKLRVVSHPPGLYQSWNHGLRQLTTDYAYLSTTGDTITRAGLLHLQQVADEFSADVVLSKPAFHREDGRPAPEPAWPLDDILEHRQARVPRRLAPLEMVVYAAAHPDGGLLGSSASNLYRTRCLQSRPFPTEYGAAGDGAWAVLHAHEVVWAVTPERFSTFLLHPKHHAPGAKPLRLDLLLREALARAVNDGIVAESQLQPARMAQLIDAATRWLDAKAAFDRDRDGRWPWSLNPAAWRRRRARNRQRRLLDAQRVKALAAILACSSVNNAI